ncbi:MAG: hypothetical protein JSV80_13855 [Acidobacteriota bacterium]|nr:MAG: hypothetical protein JSV80_13855 [Acidobacteriota bacterium]
MTVQKVSALALGILSTLALAAFPAIASGTPAGSGTAAPAIVNVCDAPTIMPAFRLHGPAPGVWKRGMVYDLLIAERREGEITQSENAVGNPTPAQTGEARTEPTSVSMVNIGLVRYSSSGDRPPLSVEPRELFGALDEVRAALGL